MFTRYYITHAMTPVWITKYYWWTGGAGFSILILIQFTDIYTVKIKRQLCMWVSLIENKRPCRNQQQPNLIMINCTFGLPNLLANNLNMMCCIHQWMIRQCQQDKYQQNLLCFKHWKQLRMIFWYLQSQGLASQRETILFMTTLHSNWHYLSSLS